jgi:hypothetical protein
MMRGACCLCWMFAGREFVSTGTEAEGEGDVLLVVGLKT